MWLVRHRVACNAAHWPLYAWTTVAPSYLELPPPQGLRLLLPPSSLVTVPVNGLLYCLRECSAAQVRVSINPITTLLNSVIQRVVQSIAALTSLRSCDVSFNSRRTMHGAPPPFCRAQAPFFTKSRKASCGNP